VRRTVTGPIEVPEVSMVEFGTDELRAVEVRRT